MNRNDLNPELREGIAPEPCIGVLELCSIARGVEVADAMLWESKVELLFATPVQPGKYAILLTGGVQDVRSSLQRGAAVAESDLVDQVLIPQVHEQILPMLRRNGGTINGHLDAVGVVETTTIASTVQAADAALKRASVDLLDMRVANGLGGKSFFTLTGEVSDVRAAVGAGAESAESAGKLARQVVIPRPHADLVFHL